MDIFEKCYNYTAPDKVKEAGLYPYFHSLQSKQDVEVVMEGKRRIMLGSNNYLGLTAVPEIMEAGIKAIEDYGTGCSGSRILNGTFDFHLELEKELSDFLRQEDTMTFSTGFQANLGVIAGLLNKNDYVICDRENHASIYDGCRLGYGKMLRYKHSDMEDLEKKLILAEDHAKLIITDGVFSMSGDIANLPEIIRLAKKYDARVMVDDAHGLGVLGDGGRGTASYFDLEKEVDIYVGTFSKSLASLGGYVSAKKSIINYLKHNSRPFIFSASIPPSNGIVALESLRYIRKHPERIERLHALVRYTKNEMKQAGLNIIESNVPIIPIYTYTFENTLIKSKKIYDAGVYVNNVIPPAAPEGQCLLRTSLMANHTEELIKEAVEIIAKELS